MQVLRLKEELEILLEEYTDSLMYWFQIKNNEEVHIEEPSVVLEVCLKSNNVKILERVSIKIKNISGEYQVFSEDYDTKANIVDAHIPQKEIGSTSIPEIDDVFSSPDLFVPYGRFVKYEVTVDGAKATKKQRAINILNLMDENTSIEQQEELEKKEEDDYNLHKILYISIPASS